MARNVADAAFLTGALMGPEPLDPIYRDQSPAPFFSIPARDLSQLKVAFTTDFGTIPVSDDVRECFQSVAGRIARFFKNADWRHPECGDVDSTFEALRAVGFAHAFGDHLRQHRSVASPLLIANMETAEALTVADVGRAHAAQSNLFRKFQAFFDDVDVLICPTAPVMPFPVDELYVKKVGNVEMASYIRWIALNYTITLSTHPTTAIPAGVGPNGLPFGIQVVGRHADDVGTLAIAAALESEFSKDPKLARPRPDIRKLSTPGLETRAGQIPPELISSGR
jgi:Asp-tRNA(Asn)/Glu-tRNA(Gln) amidotransferase A subunit family amidase